MVYILQRIKKSLTEDIIVRGDKYRKEKNNCYDTRFTQRTA